MGDAHRPLRLLSLDGGGIRGLSSLYILRSIMTNLASKAGQGPGQSLYPCDYFDLIAGTSTGGLIAVMLGVFRMDIQTCINEYLEMAPRIFPIEGIFNGSRIGKLLTVARGRQRFDPEPLEVAVKRLVREHLGDSAQENRLLRDGISNISERHECKVFVCVTSEKLSKHFRFRSYESPWDVVDDCPIWQACRATSAAPTFFPPMEIGSPPVAYVDGGLGYNNPIRVLLDESSCIWPDRKIGCVVSVGMGVLLSKDVGRTLKPLFECLEKMATDTERVSREVEKEMKHKDGVGPQTYFRFNVQHGLEYVGLEEWNEFDRTKIATEDYLSGQSRQVELCASQILDPKFSIVVPTVVPNTKFFHVNKMRVGTFVQRLPLHEKLHRGFSRNSRKTSSIPNIAVIYGFGGAGKSQLVLNFVQEVKNTYVGVFWIDASGPDTVEREFEYLYRHLVLNSSYENQNLPKIAELINLVRHWFVQQAGKFLLIFDGADHIGDAKNASYVDLNRLIPQNAPVDIIITTRISTAQKFGSFSVEVHEMEKDEALALFNNSSGLAQEQRALSQQDEAERIVAELGYFALAIDLAGSYIKNTPLILGDLPRYLQRYREQRIDLLDREPDQHLHQYNKSVLKTLEMSFEAVSCKSNIAANLLSFLAFLDAGDILPELFDPVDRSHVGDTTYDKDIYNWKDAICHERVLTIHDVEEAFLTLRSFSMVRWVPNQASYSIHKLVHARSLDRLSLNEQVDMISATACFLQTRIRDGLGPLEKNLRFSAHLMANFSIMSQTLDRNYIDKVVHTGLLELPSYTAFLGNLGHWSSKAKIESYLLGLANRVLGIDHAYTISAMSNYASTLGDQDQGALNEAAEIKREVIEKRTWLLGVEHPDTISAINNYAGTLRDQGKIDEAAKIQKEVIEKMIRLLGAEHPDTISTINNYTSTLRDQGKIDEAAKIQKEVIEKRTRLLGAEHPHTISSMSNYTSTLRNQGKIDEAAKIQKEVIEKRTRLLGAEHPDTISSMSNYASTLRDQGKIDEAAKIQKEVIEKRTRLLGAEHPHTISSMNNYANTLGDQGNLNEAAKLKREVIEKRTRLLGAEHPYTISAMSNYANILGDQGKLDEAEYLIRKVLEKMTRLHGAEHPHTKIAANVLRRVKVARMKR